MGERDPEPNMTWRWEGPDLDRFVAQARLVNPITLVDFDPLQVAERFGLDLGGSWSWVSLEDEETPWDEYFLVGPVSRIGARGLQYLFGHPFDGKHKTEPPSQGPTVAKARPPGGLLDKTQAAAFLGIGVTTFKQLVMGQIPSIPVGRRILFDEKDLLQWRDMQKVGSSSSPKRAGPSLVSGSPTARLATSDPRVRAIVARLTKRRRGSTPR